MTNVDNFKSFVKKNPNLVSYVRNGDMSWQKFYELYDIYGEDTSIWKDYIERKDDRSVNNKKSTTSSTGTFEKIIDMTKNIDANKLQDGITSIQKAISLFGDILSKDKTDTGSSYTPRPIYRRFDD